MQVPETLPARKLDAHIRAAWQTQVAAAKQTLGLLPQLVQRRQDLLPRFASAYDQLCILPRRVRRRLQRHWKQSLAGVALLLVLGSGDAQAGTTINVPAGVVSALITAINEANSEVAPYDGADTIVLANSTFTLTAPINTTLGASGLPEIISEITIEGNGSTIKRDSGATHFRIVAISDEGNLTLRDTTLSGGVTEDITEGLNNGLKFFGGGISVNYGQLQLEGCTISGNSASERGGGVSTRTDKSVTILNSTLSGNSTDSYGGGIGIFAKGHSVQTLTNSTLSGNQGSQGGGASLHTENNSSVNLIAR